MGQGCECNFSGPACSTLSKSLLVRVCAREAQLLNFYKIEATAGASRGRAASADRRSREREAGPIAATRPVKRASAGGSA